MSCGRYTSYVTDKSNGAPKDDSTTFLPSSTDVCQGYDELEKGDEEIDGESETEEKRRARKRENGAEAQRNFRRRQKAALAERAVTIARQRTRIAELETANEALKNASKVYEVYCQYLRDAQDRKLTLVSALLPACTAQYTVTPDTIQYWYGPGTTSET